MVLKKETLLAAIIVITLNGASYAQEDFPPPPPYPDDVESSFHPRGGMGFGMHGHHGNKKQMKENLLKSFSESLDLTSEQQSKLEKILDDKHAKMEAIRKEMGPKIKAIRESTKDEIRAILSDDQKKKFDEIHSKRKAQMEKRRNKLLKQVLKQNKNQ